MVGNKNVHKKEDKKLFNFSSVSNSYFETVLEKLNIIFPTILFVVIWPLLAFYERDLLIKIESQSLFIFDYQFFINTFNTVGGLLSYISAFFTQFLSKPWLGALFFALLLEASFFLTSKAFDIPKRWCILALFPSILFFSANLHIGYFLFTIKEQGFFFSSIVGYLVMISMILLFRNTRRPIPAAVEIIVFAVIGYLAIGFWALLGLIAIIINLMKRHQKSIFIYILSIFTLLLLIATPLIYYNIFTDRVISDIFTIGFPKVPMDGSSFSLFIPCLSVILFTLIMTILANKEVDKNATLKNEIIINASIIIFFILIIVGFWNRDSNFRAEIKMSVAVDNMDWKRILQIHKQFTDPEGKDKTNEPTRVMVEYKNLALIKQGLEGNLAYSYMDGGKKQKSTVFVSMMAQCGKQLYFHYGIINYCYRWCIEDGVEYGWNNSDLKYAVMSSLLSGDYGVAKKYLSILKKTLFYKKWALKQEQYLTHTEEIAKSDSYKSIIPLICKENNIDNDQVLIEPFLIKYFTKHRSVFATPEFDRIALFWAMQTQDIATFWQCFSYYTSSNVISKMPRYYQEAALLYGNLEHSVDISSMPFDKEVISSFQRFNQFASKNPVSNLDASRPLYYENFGNTFYYYYYFIRNLKSF